MRSSLPSLLLFGVAVGATGVAPVQQILKAPEIPASSTWQRPLKEFKGIVDTLTTDAQVIWDEVAALFPEAMSQASFLSPPKRHTRKSSNHWDYITKGQDIEELWIQGHDGNLEREIDGDLASYNMRSKRVKTPNVGVDPGVKQISGYLDDEESDKHLFFWFFESRNDPKNDPVVLWLNGGPGCSSLTGLFFELGSARIDSQLKVVQNPYSWNSNASVIFLDQPVNVGYSYSGSSVSNSVAAGKDVYALLTLFFKQFPQYNTPATPLSIAGESYAGHYIPVLAAEILSHKKRNFNLTSILIGNGLTDPLNQYPAYRPMACGDGGWSPILDESACQSMDNALPRCLSLIQTCYDSESVWSCVPASIYCNNAIIGPYQRTGQNPYDVRVKCGDNPLCYDGLDDISKWLNQPAVMEELGAEVESYESCNFDINRNFLFQGDWMKPFHRLVPSILEEIPVLIYAGDADFICNWLGNNNWTDALDWYGSVQYQKVGLTDLMYKGHGHNIGQVKSSGNLTFMRILNAGHMVPYDQPAASLDFFNRWLAGEWF